MSAKDIRDSLTSVAEHFIAHPDQAVSQDKPAKATLEGGLRIRVEGPSGWAVTTDMPSALGGSGSAPSPGWLRRAAQAACEATMIAIKAAQDGIDLRELVVTVGSVSDDRGMLGLAEEVPAGPTESWAHIRLVADDVPADKLRRIAQWAEDHSPVTESLRRSITHRLELDA
jgi:uncharacterized OsmC-like protein